MVVSKNEPRRRASLSFRKKLLFSTATTLLFFLLFEGSLRLIGIASFTATEDPFVGFSAALPLMELAIDDNGQEVLRTAQNKLHWFNAQTFPKKKSAGTKRIFCMGGSTTYGHPFWDETSFSGWLREFLPVVEPSHKWEVINAGGISYASYRVAALMDELAQYEPDLFVVYSVHNEFLERRTYQTMFSKSKTNLRLQGLLAGTRTWTLVHRFIQQSSKLSGAEKRGPPTGNVDVLPAEVDEILNHTIGPVDYHRDRQWTAKVIYHYEVNLRRMVAIAQASGAKIVFVTPASNEKDCSPFKSEHDPSLSSLESDGLEEAVRLNPHCAALYYRLGHHYFSHGRFQDAQKAFSHAINEDICPLRAVDDIRSSIERVARDTGVPVVDFERNLRELSQIQLGHSILGEEYFLDHVHPTIDVNRRLALWIISTLQSDRWMDGKPVLDPDLSGPLTDVQDKVLGQIDREDQGFALRNLAKVLHWAGKFDEAAPLAQATLEILPDDPESRFVLAGCWNQTNRKEEALGQYELLFADGADFPRAYQPFGELLAEMGRLQEAKAYLILALLRNPNNAGAYFSLGRVHMELGEVAFAIEALEKADQLYPNDPATVSSLAKAKSLLP